MSVLLLLWFCLLNAHAVPAQEMISVPCRSFTPGEVMRYGVLAEVDEVMPGGRSVQQRVLLLYTFRVLEASRRGAVLEWTMTAPLLQPGLSRDPRVEMYASRQRIELVVDRKHGVVDVRNAKELNRELVASLPELDPEHGREIAGTLGDAELVAKLVGGWAQRAAPLFLGPCHSAPAAQPVAEIFTRDTAFEGVSLEQTARLTLSHGQREGTVGLYFEASFRAPGANSTGHAVSVRDDLTESVLDAETGEALSVFHTRTLHDGFHWKRDIWTYVLLSEPPMEHLVPRFMPATLKLADGSEMQVLPDTLPELSVTMDTNETCNVTVELPTRRVTSAFGLCAPIFEGLLRLIPGWSFTVDGGPYEGAIRLHLAVRASPDRGSLWSAAGVTIFGGGLGGGYQLVQEWWIPPRFAAMVDTVAAPTPSR